MINTLRSIQKFINSVFKLTQLPLLCPHYSCINNASQN
ncbi:hypothetical protein ERW52_02050 [Aliivibrio finisterrensis]|uniref:Uncharacterized protein n=1 Tax=Aliivibrio finisterrensis TaxID=511998 RepID=A0A4Q5L0U5_9GAMM|nr:hypothetical protein ERW56_11850 [Aliivibrio finisterrensis]RYU55030.1 hypothetical protein ERW57_00320 [Aliivibrio finisterrensis]RYU57667.1 hypothetical protein ERW50_11260 [Aliivibrio finisterrensis]RYU66951.1 hypothetical protein ERW53_01850 [Aliivibrio finisterrensis]RYU83197.1 hypothetical protein ERW55_12070 [Aliivibrio finisterrensis]